jgi:hypothetical protein
MEIGRPRRAYRIARDPVPKASSFMPAKPECSSALRRPPLADRVEFGDDVLVSSRFENLNGNAIASKRTCKSIRVAVPMRPLGGESAGQTANVDAASRGVRHSNDADR